MRALVPLLVTHGIVFVDFFFSGGSEEVGQSAPTAQTNVEAYNTAFAQMGAMAPQVEAAWNSISTAYNTGVLRV